MDYFAHSALSRTDLKNILTSPKYFYNLKTGIIEPKQSNQMQLGTLIHQALLEPDKFASENEVLRSITIKEQDIKAVKGQCRWEQVDAVIDGDTTYYIFAEPDSETALATMQERLQNYHGKPIILPSVYSQINRMVESLWNNPIVERCIAGAVPEQMLVGEIDGCPVKCKADAYNPNLGIIMDYKTTDRSINPKSFAWEISKWALDIQAYLYQEIFRQNGMGYNFKFIVQNKSSYESIVFNPSNAILEQGERKAKLAIGIYKACSENNKWHDFVDEFGNDNSSAEFDLNLPQEREEL